MPYAEAAGRLVFMSWNPGAGARKLAEVIDTGGYHVVAVQEAREDILARLDRDRWSYTIDYGQFIGARCPNTVQSHCGEETKGRIRWHFATVKFHTKRVGKDSMGILSLHLNNIHAKKPQAGPEEIGNTIDKSMNFDAWCQVDIICGDLNMARWSKRDDSLWHEATLDQLEKRDFYPVADYVKECCFVAVHESIAHSLHIKGSSWAERAQKFDDDERQQFWTQFLDKVGAKQTSHDVHWPMPLALRMPLSVRSSGLRQRTPAAAAKRNAKKRLRGYIGDGRSSGSYWDSGGSNSAWGGRSSGWWNWWQSDSRWQWR